MRWASVALLVVVTATATVLAQTPRPFPTPRSGATAPVPAEQPAPPATGQTAGTNAPTEATLGVPVYPTAQFLTSYDAGRGQRYYLFGAQAGFTETVTYYRTLLKQKGEVVFDQPPTHTFEVGRYRAETMAFPPGVTVKDFAFGGSEGYVNPKPAGTPKYFPTIIQIVPIPAGAR
jgi:hypothetical protein